MTPHPPSLADKAIVHIPIDGLSLEGELVIPPGAKGIVLFVHGSGSSRHSPRNKFVAQKLQTRSLATLLVDLLSEEEDSDYAVRFNIKLLSQRLSTITDWIKHNKATKGLALGYFGASTGAAAAIDAAVAYTATVKAVVSRGGRVDLARGVIDQLAAPTLLIVGQHDYFVLEANETAFLNMKCQKKLSIVPGATHLFEEPGALDRVAQLAARWFEKYLGGIK